MKGNFAAAVVAHRLEVDVRDIMRGKRGICGVNVAPVNLFQGKLEHTVEKGNGLLITILRVIRGSGREIRVNNCTFKFVN